MTDVVADAVLRLRSIFIRPRHLATVSAWVEHVPFAFWMMEALRPSRVVELGVHNGVSYFSFCQAAEHLKLNTQCYGIDLWNGDEHAGFYGPEVFVAVAQINAQYSGFSQLLRSSFDDAKCYFEDSSIDLLHIDGLHTVETVRKDFESWLPKLSKRAVVLLHDTNVRERNFGVWALFAELREKYPTFEFSHGHGLGVVGVGAEQSSQMQALFTAGQTAAEAQAIHVAFSQLGHGCLQTQQRYHIEGLLRSERASAATTQQQLADLLAQQEHRDPHPPEEMSTEDLDRRRELEETIETLEARERELTAQLDAEKGQTCQLSASLQERFGEIALLSAKLMAKGEA